jgi:hypothetical protein
MHSPPQSYPPAPLPTSRQEMQASFFGSLTDTRPIPWRGALERLVKRLSRHTERAEKEGPGWSPAVYVPGATRGNAGVQLVWALVSDYDHYIPPWELLDGYEWLAYTTHSHREDDPRWRVVVFLVRPVPAADWPGFWQRARAALLPHGDEACKDESRYFYLPACRPGAPREIRRGHGWLLDPDELPPVPTPLGQDRPVGPPIVDGQGGRPGDDFNRRATWGAILTPHGWRLLYERGSEAYWRRPGKDRGLSATTGYAGARLLYVFSSSAAPFAPATWYTPFSALALLEHNADFTEAARALALRGYGEPGRVVRGSDGLRRRLFVPQGVA